MKVIYSPLLSQQARAAAEEVVARIEKEAPLYAGAGTPVELHEDWGARGESGYYAIRDDVAHVYDERQLGKARSITPGLNYSGWKKDIEKDLPPGGMQDLSLEVQDTILHELYHARQNKNADAQGWSSIVSPHFFERYGLRSDSNKYSLPPLQEGEVARLEEMIAYAGELGIPSMQGGSPEELAASIVPVLDALFGLAPSAKGTYTEQRVTKLREKYPEEVDAFYFRTRSPETPTPKHINGPPNLPNLSIGDSIELFIRKLVQ